MAGITDTRMRAGITVTGLIATGAHTGKRILPANYINSAMKNINGIGTERDGTGTRINGLGITIETETETEIEIRTGTGIEVGIEIGING